MRLTLAKVNAALKAAGIDAELVRGSGYHYFIGPDVDLAMNTSVAVYRLSELPLDEWLAEARAIATQSAAKKL